VAAFIRQLTHDVRNQLNGLELEAALMADSVPEPEIVEGVVRIREQLHNTAGHLRMLSAKFADPSPIISSITAVELFLIFQEQAASMEELPPIKWTHSLKEERINVDATELANAAKELLSNARQFGTKGELKINGRVNKKNVVYEFHEPKSAPVETERWGYAPFISTRRNSYGLGLWEARRLVEANHGQIAYEYDPKSQELRTTLSFHME
jgi:nitrogen-specific signal transduction histidine kinase